MIDAASNLVKVFLVHPSKAECLPLVAALAVVEVVAAEGAPVVVAGHAVLRAARAEVLRGPRRRDLSALTRAREHAVALVAAQALTRAVLRVAEADRVGARTRRRAADGPAGIVSATPRRAGRWQEAQPCSGRPPPVMWHAWSKRMLKEASPGNDFTGGFGPSRLVWQLAQSAPVLARNCWT